MKEYNETDAITAMRSALPEERRTIYSDDDLLEVIDLIFDCYEENGELDINVEADDDINDDAEIEKTAAFVARFIKKDKNSKIELEDIPALVRGEYTYELSLI